MHDITVLGTLRARLSGPITPRHRRADDEEDALLARVLITSWSLATGRTLRSDVPPPLLTEDELIAFWADDADGDRHPGPAQAEPALVTQVGRQRRGGTTGAGQHY